MGSPCRASLRSADLHTPRRPDAHRRPRPAVRDSGSIARAEHLGSMPGGEPFRPRQGCARLRRLWAHSTVCGSSTCPGASPGPLGVMLLAEQGADVIKVEPPGGDPFRAYSGYAVWNRSRRSVTVDLKRRAGPRGVRGASSTTPTCSSRRSAPASPTASASATTRCTRATRGSSTSRARATPRATASPTGPATTRSVQASSGQQWEQPGWRMGPDLPAHADAEHGRVLPDPDRDPRRADRAREHRTRPARARRRCSRARCSTPRRSGSTSRRRRPRSTTSWARATRRASTSRCSSRSPNGEWVHASVMSGLTPTKSQDELLGLEDPPDPMTFLTMPPEEREQFTARRREHVQATHDRDDARRELPGAQPRDRGGHHDGGGARRSGHPHPQLVANGMVATVDDPELGAHHADRRADQPARHARRRSRARSRCPASTTPRSSALLGYSDAELAAVTGGAD